LRDAADAVHVRQHARGDAGDGRRDVRAGARGQDQVGGAADVSAQGRRGRASRAAVAGDHRRDGAAAVDTGARSPMEDAARFQGTIPELYDRHLGPVIFEPYAADLATRVAAAMPCRLLEIACGSGIATARLRAALPAGCAIVATDLNDGMIACARAKP